MLDVTKDQAFLIGFLPSAILAWPIYRALLALKARQTVSQHVAEHAHKQGTPTMGGLIILCGLVAFALYGLIAPPPDRRWAGIPVLVIGYALIGFVDDFVIPRLMKGKRGLGWTQKLLLQVGLAALSMWLLQPVSLLAFAFGVFCVLFFSNAFNFTDGLDWLASSVLVALAIGAILVTPNFFIHHVWFAIIGATLPFMLLNRPPAKIFMGDVGSMPVGALIGLLLAATAWTGVAPVFAHGKVLEGVLYPGTGPASPLIWVALVVLSFVMIAELVPVPLQIASVKLRKKRLFPMTPIHHAFQKAGWKETKVVALFFWTQVVCSAIAVALVYLARQNS